jgi:hypothetical protein
VQYLVTDSNNLAIFGVCGSICAHFCHSRCVKVPTTAKLQYYTTIAPTLPVLAPLHRPLLFDLIQRIAAVTAAVVVVIEHKKHSIQNSAPNTEARYTTLGLSTSHQSKHKISGPHPLRKFDCLLGGSAFTKNATYSMVNGPPRFANVIVYSRFTYHIHP